MFTYVKQLAIYGHDTTERVIRFHPGVNIITGESHTGKSTVLNIINYCLGSSSNPIPHGIVRDFADWFVIHVVFDSVEIMIGRPGDTSSTRSSNVFLRRGTDLNLPAYEELAPSTNLETLKRELSYILGLPARQGNSPDPTLRDFVPLLFQPQNTITNKDVLFPGTDDPFRRKRLQTILPFSVGTAHSEYLHNQKTLQQLEAQLAAVEEQLETVSLPFEIVRQRAREFVMRLSLLDPNRGKWNESVPPLEQLQRYLAGAEEQVSFPLPLPEAGAELDLWDRSRTLRNQLFSVQREMTRIGELLGAGKLYELSLTLREGRLEAMNTLDRLAKGPMKSECPLCGSDSDVAGAVAAEYREYTKELTKEVESVYRSNPALEARYFALKQQATELREQIVSCEQQVLVLQQHNEQTKKMLRSWAYYQQTIGEVREFVSGADDSQTRLRGLRQRLVKDICELRHTLNKDGELNRFAHAIERINSHMNRYADYLDFEWKPNLRFNPDTLSVYQILGDTVIDMHKMGSAANWITCHLSLALALHRYFADTPSSPVPSLLMLDQPSQVYFQSWAPDSEIEDQHSVRRIFEALFRASTETRQSLQIIVVDHADFPDWTQFDAAVVARFTNGRALI